MKRFWEEFGEVAFMWALGFIVLGGCVAAAWIILAVLVGLIV